MFPKIENRISIKYVVKAKIKMDLILTSFDKSHLMWDKVCAFEWTLLDLTVMN